MKHIEKIIIIIIASLVGLLFYFDISDLIKAISVSLMFIGLYVSMKYFPKIKYKELEFSCETNARVSSNLNIHSRLDSFIKEFPLPIVICNKKNKIINVNDTTIKIYGYSYSELMTMSFEDLQYLKYKSTHCNKDGEIFPVRILKKIVIDDSIVYVIENIENLKKLKNSLGYYKTNYDNLSSLFKIVSNTISQMIWAKDLDNRYSYINSKAAKVLYGLDNPDDAIGKKESDLLKPIIGKFKHTFQGRDDKSDFIVISQKKPLHYNDFGYSVGKWIDIQIKKCPMLNREGELIGVIGIAKDITSAVQLEKRKKDIYNIAKIGDWYKNAISNNIEWSNGLYDLYELDKNHITEPLDYYYTKFIHPDDLEIFEQYREDLFMETEAYSEYRLILNGKIKHTLVKGKAIRDNNNNIISFYGIQQDITELKTAEKRLIESKQNYNRLLDFAPVGIMSCNLEGEIDFINTKLVETLHVTKRQAKKINLFKYPNMVKYGIANVFKEAIDKNKLITQEGLYKTEDLKYDYYYRIFVSPLKKDDMVYGAIGVIEDYTNRKAVENALEESNEVLENFAYTTSHDLKTPLRGVTSFIDKLIRRLDLLDSDLINDDKINVYVKFIKKSVYQMNSIITDTLNYSKVNKDDLILTDCNLLNCIDEAIPYELYGDNDNIKIKILINDAVIIRGDKNQLIRVIQNLISNGLKFNSKEIKEVEIGFNEKDNYLYVKDNGDGISEEYYDRIFNLFQRLHGSKIEGNGLGLAIVKRVIQRHDWTIKIESKLEEGSIFKIYF